MRVTTRFGQVGLAALALTVWFGRLSGQELPSQYLVRDLGPYPDQLYGGGPGFAPAALNDRGVLVGWAYAGYSKHAFRWTDGTLVDLGLFPGAPPFFQSFALSINNRGQILGTAQSVSDLTLHPALFDGGSITDLGGIFGANSLVSAINDEGQIAGTMTVGVLADAALLDRGVLTDLGVLPGGIRSLGVALNNHGDMVGFSGFMSPQGATGEHAFLYSHGVMADLGTLPLGSQFSEALGINDAGQVAGVSACATPDHAFLYANGQMVDLGTFGGPLSSATGINQQGVVVGFAALAPDTSHAFVFAAGVMHDLNDMVPAVPGRTLVGALAINNRGQILTTGYLQGEYHSFLLDPNSLGRFHPLPQCRVVDTRWPDGVNGGPALAANADRAFQIGGTCGLPPTTSAVAFNFAVTQPSQPGSIGVLPTDGTAPIGASLSWRAGQTRANSALLGIDSAGRLAVHLDQPAGTAHLVVDISGYFE